MFEGASVKVNMPENFEIKSMDPRANETVTLNLKSERQGERKWNNFTKDVMEKLRDLYERLTGKLNTRTDLGRDDR